MQPEPGSWFLRLHLDSVRDPELGLFNMHPPPPGITESNFCRVNRLQNVVSERRHLIWQFLPCPAITILLDGRGQR